MGNSYSKRIERYSAVIERLSSAARSRATQTGQVYNDFMVAEQVVMRSIELSKSTFYVEKAAIIAWLEDTPDINEESRKTGLELLSRNRDDLMQWGRDRLTEIVGAVIDGGDMRAPEEISFEICALSTQPTRRKKSKAGHVPVSPHDIDRLTQALIDIDPLSNLVARLRKAKVENSQALSAILLHSCWLTGMRPIEMFSCALVIARDDDVVVSPDDIDAQIPDITDRDFTGLRGLLAVGVAIGEIEKREGGQVMLAIRNAKTQNANPETVQEYRVLRLGEIDAYRLGVLWMTTQLRRLQITPKEIESLRDLVSRHARVISRRIMPGRKPVTLYTMRHDFADRAKLRYGKPEVAALMGHTGKNSAAHYGTKGLRRSSGGVQLGRRTPAGWMPQPDEAQALRLLSKWNPSLQRDPEVSLELADFTPQPLTVAPAIDAPAAPAAEPSIEVSSLPELAP